MIFHRANLHPINSLGCGKLIVGGVCMRKIIQWICGVFTVASISALIGIGYWNYRLPDEYYVEQGQSLIIDHGIIADTAGNEVKAVGAIVGESYDTTLKWWGIFPIKDVAVTVVKQPVVVLGGTPFGVKLYTDGVMVVSFSTVDGINGTVNPAKEAGLKVGDLILSINGKSVYTNEEVADCIKESSGKTMIFRIKRGTVESEIRFCAVRSKSENCYKAGLWVRDSSAGIGTLTFYDPKTNTIAGLGHAVCDVDTGNIVPISSGEIVPARIYGVTKSQAGIPGELRGGFESGSYGPLVVNGTSGVYALCNEETVKGETIEVALKQEIKEGAAKVYTTVSGKKPQWYDIRITQVRYHDENATRNMIIEITDKDLLKLTGGIVQGMSGSPIVQHGKLVGAVTHVLVNDPAKGYAIFAENMLETAQNIDIQNRKDAS